MSSEEIRQRADLIGTPVVTRDTAKKLGIVSQLWVDIDQQEVVALSVRPSIFYGTPQPMMLSSIRQIGDVILVDNEDVLEDLDTEIYTPLTNCEVITETGDLLGKVRGFKFDIDNGRLSSIIIASLGLPLIPDQVVSTYELSIDEVVSSGPDRLIVFEGSEERLQQMSVGVLERLGIGRAPWEREFDTVSTAPVRSDNMLGTGLRTPLRTELKQRTPERELQEWDEDNWDERRQEEPRRMQRYYEEDDESYGKAETDNWSEASGRDTYDDRGYGREARDVPDQRADGRGSRSQFDRAWDDRDRRDRPGNDDAYDDDLDRDPWQESQRPENQPEARETPIRDAEIIEPPAQAPEPAPPEDAPKPLELPTQESVKQPEYEE
jgi:sporulation protein YlmC with PRC-barrel domain